MFSMSRFIRLQTVIVLHVYIVTLVRIGIPYDPHKSANTNTYIF